MDAWWKSLPASERAHSGCYQTWQSSCRREPSRRLSISRLPSEGYFHNFSNTFRFGTNPFAWMNGNWFFVAIPPHVERRSSASAVMKNCFSCINCFPWRVRVTFESPPEDVCARVWKQSKFVTLKKPIESLLPPRFEFHCNWWWNYAEKCNKISSTFLYFLLSIHFNLPTITFEWLFDSCSGRKRLASRVAPKKGEKLSSH